MCPSYSSSLGLKGPGHVDDMDLRFGGVTGGSPESAELGHPKVTRPAVVPRRDEKREAGEEAGMQAVGHLNRQ